MNLRKIKRHRPQQGASAGAPPLLAAMLDKGRGYQQQGRLDLAIDCYAKATRLAPQDAVAVHQLGVAHYLKGELGLAEVYYRRACDLAPTLGSAHYNLGNLLIGQGKIMEALPCLKEAARLEPDNDHALTNIGVALYELGRVEEAIVYFEEALAVNPAASHLHSTLVSALHYLPEASAYDIMQKSRQWWKIHGRPLYRRLRHANVPAPTRRLKVGYLSPDFREHSISYFITPLLEAHDRSQYEVFCYSDVEKPDAATTEIKALADHWRDSFHLSDEALTLAIERDGIDLLIDLTGHMTGNRLSVFARKPAPVQISWLGYPGTTGLPTIDYRLVDAITDPPGEADLTHSERLIRLPGCFLCYQPPTESLEPGSVPAESSGRFTFGSFNNPAKLNPPLIETWAALLGQLPHSRLLLKGRHLSDHGVQLSFLDSFVGHGIPAARISFSPLLPGRREHLALYNDIDLCLDPFPYNGTTTTMEALWMGVPVLTLRGTRHASRVGSSILQGLGRPDLIAATPESYIETAIALASSPRQDRKDLRRQLLASSLCDRHLFARRLEDAYRQSWQAWCQGQAGFTPKSSDDTTV